MRRRLAVLLLIVSVPMLTASKPADFCLRHPQRCQSPSPSPTTSPSPSPTLTASPTPTAVPTVVPTASPTQAPTAIPTATPTPAATATSSPTPSSACTRVATAPTDGTDATAALAADIAATPDGGTLCLKAATYRLNGEFHIDTRTNLTIEGNGAILQRPAPASTPLLGIRVSSGITVRNLTLDGANPFAQGVLTYEAGHGIRVDGSLSTLIEGVTIRNVGGDGIYLSGGWLSSSTFRASDGFEFRNGLIDGTGRNAVSLTDGADHTSVDHNSIRYIGYYTFDIEANGLGYGAHYAAFTDNVLGPVAYSYVPAVHGYLFAVTGSSGGGPAEHIDWSRNTISGLPFRIGVFNNGGTRVDIKVDSNKTDTLTSAVPLELTFSGVTGLTVTNNIGFADSDLQVSSCTGVIVSGNAG